MLFLARFSDTPHVQGVTFELKRVTVFQLKVVLFYVSTSLLWGVIVTVFIYESDPLLSVTPVAFCLSFVSQCWLFLTIK